MGIMTVGNRFANPANASKVGRMNSFHSSSPVYQSLFPRFPVALSRARVERVARSVTKAAQEQATAHRNGSEMVSGFGPQQVFRFSSQAEIAILALR
jgi:hypothetical protein